MNILAPAPRARHRSFTLPDDLYQVILAVPDGQRSRYVVYLLRLGLETDRAQKGRKRHVARYY